MRQGMARLTPRFSANRTIREYAEKYYLPAAQRYRHRAENDGALAVELVNMCRRIEDHWQGIYFGKFEIRISENGHLLQVQVYLNDLLSDAIEVELFADELDGLLPEKHPMTRGERLLGANGWLFTAHVVSTRRPEHFTPRICPRHPELLIPLESPQIKWQR